MEHLRKFNEGEVNNYNMDDYVWLPMFCTRDNRDLDISIFTDHNVSGYGLGLKGDYFDKHDFNKAISKVGDDLRRKLYTIDELDILLRDLGINLPKPEAIKEIVRRVKETRDDYCTANPKWERDFGVYVELEEIEDMLKD